MAKVYDVYVGSEIGYLKGYSFKNDHWSNLNSVKQSKKQEILCSHWSKDHRQILYVEKPQLVKTYELDSGQLDTLKELSGNSPLKGLLDLGSCYVTCAENGDFSVWDEEEIKLEKNIGDNIRLLATSSTQSSLVGSGGKENELKIWDVENSCAEVFRAKNVKNDWLNLRVPVWVTGIAFLSDCNEVATCTAHHQIRLYDSKAQRRPVVDFTWEEDPFTALAPVRNTKYLIVGNSKGNMAMADVRKPGKMVHVYKGFAGAIRSIAAHTSQPLVASCGLDRFLRVHHIESKQLLTKVYMKSRLNTVLFADDLSCHDVTGNQSHADTNQKGKNDIKDDDVLWEDMEEIDEEQAEAAEEQELDDVIDDESDLDSDEDSGLDVSKQPPAKKRRKGLAGQKTSKGKKKAKRK